MEYITNQLDTTVKEETVLTLGKFDGLHRGHELLMENLLKIGNTNRLKTVVFTFDIPPKSSCDNTEALVLTTNEEKKEVFEGTGVDMLFECPFTPEVMQMSPEAFICWMVTAFHVKAIVAGEDFGFGYKRAGTVDTLREYADKYGYFLRILEKVKEDGREISSTFVREEIKKGNIKKANHLLGYPYFVKSEVIHGRQLGRMIGIPTMNMEPPGRKLLPKNGVYLTSVVMGQHTYPAVTNVGCKPTVKSDAGVGVETHVLDYAGDAYGKRLRVDFLDFLRPEQKFSSVEELKEQMTKDVENAKNLYSYYKNITK